MDTPSLPTSKPQRVYVQHPTDLQHFLDFDKFLHDNGWKRTEFGDYYNKEKKVYSSAKELYPMFRNIK